MRLYSIRLPLPGKFPYLSNSIAPVCEDSKALFVTCTVKCRVVYSWGCVLYCRLSFYKIIARITLMTSQGLFYQERAFRATEDLLKLFSQWVLLLVTSKPRFVKLVDYPFKQKYQTFVGSKPLKWDSLLLLPSLYHCKLNSVCLFCLISPKPNWRHHLRNAFSLFSVIL